MRTYILIALGIIALTLLCAAIFIVIKDKGTEVPPVEDPVTVPVGNLNQGSQTVERDTFVITTRDGKPLEVTDFTKDPRTTSDLQNAGSYFVGGHFPVTEAEPQVTPPYTITYIQDTQFFNIGLYAEPLSDTRKKAETYLRAQLGLKDAQMCELNYMVSTPVYVNEFYGGNSLGFSFCPGSVSL